MQELSPRERRQERTRQAILDTTLELIKEKGLNKLSLREIARRIDYSPAGLYEYFGSKDEIVEAVVCDADARFFGHLNRVSKDLSSEDYLIELGMAYMDFARLYPDHFYLMFTEYRTVTDIDLPNYMPDDNDTDDAYGLLIHAVQRAVDTGVFKTREGYGTFEITYTIWALVHGMAMLQTTYLQNFEWDYQVADRSGLQAMIKGLQQG